MKANWTSTCNCVQSVVIKNQRSNWKKRNGFLLVPVRFGSFTLLYSSASSLLGQENGNEYTRGWQRLAVGGHFLTGLSSEGGLLSIQPDPLLLPEQSFSHHSFCRATTVASPCHSGIGDFFFPPSGEGRGGRLPRPPPPETDHPQKPVTTIPLLLHCLPLRCRHFPPPPPSQEIPVHAPRQSHTPQQYQWSLPVFPRLDIH